MTRVFCIISIFILAHLPTVGQVALLDRVYDYIQEGDLKRAEEAISKAEKHIATANDARTYYLKAFVYKEYFTASAGEAKKTHILLASQGVEKCRQLDHDLSFEKPLSDLENFIISTLYNEGTDHFNERTYSFAIDFFQLFISKYSKKDSRWLDAHYFVGTSYYALELLDSAEVYLEMVHQHNYDEPLLFADLTYLYLRKNQAIKAGDVISEGILRYPGYFDLEIAQLNVIAAMGDFQKLETVVEDFLANNPMNVEALLMAGTAYQKNRTQESGEIYFYKSERVYKTVLSIDSGNFDANYNLGVLYYNEAVDIVNRSDIDTDIDELTRVLEISTEFFRKSLPLLLTIYDNQNPSLKLLTALQAIYYNLNMKPELAQVNAQIKELSKGGL
jgi:TolA-binding protein